MMGNRTTNQNLRLGLVGYPLGHSLSPRIHRAALCALDIQGEYRLYPISPTPEGRIRLEELLRQVKYGHVLGLNVTIPHKQTIIPCLDELTPTARAIGAINTVFKEGQILVGDNTDAPGFLLDLERFLKTSVPVGRKSTTKADGMAVVIGAGGAARAVVYALGQAGWNVVLAARRLEQAIQVVDDFQQLAFGRQLSTIKLDRASLFNLNTKIALIVNTTPLGMSPHEDASPWPDGVRLPSDAIVYDLVYNPRETVFVRKARAAGLLATTGLGMLVEQAALAFERWTGFAAPRDAMHQAAQGV